MLIKVFSTGTGGGEGPTGYCCNTLVPTIITVPDPITGQLKSAVLRDESGASVMHERIPPPEILAGDRNRTKQLIDSLDTKWRYTSGVIAFAPEDNPTDEQQRQIMADFEAGAFAGLDRDQYDILWVRHTHEGSTELHFVIPRVELESGKSYNPAPPGWDKTFDPLRDYWNYTQGWARPDDLNRARTHQPGHVAHQQAANLRAGLTESINPKQDITDYLTDRIVAGMIENRAGILAALEEADIEINRQGKDYISVRLEPNAKPIRLKGAIYGENFERTELIRAIEDQDGVRPAADRFDDPERARAARQRFEEAIERRTNYNNGRYPNRDQQADRPFDLDVGINTERNGATEHTDSEILDKTHPDSSDDLDRHLRRQLGADYLPVERYSESDRAESGIIQGSRTTSADTNPDQGKDLGGNIQRGQRWEIFGSTRRDDGPTGVDNAERQSRHQAWDKIRGVYDGIRTAIAERIRKAIDSVRNGTEAASRADQQLEQSSADISQGTHQLNQQVDRAIRGLAMRRDDEITRFKTDINLVEYAEAQGYEIDRHESSRSSVVMRQGDDKIIVATDQKDGHGVYFSVRDDQDNGSIIDFVQRRQGLNLGEARKELRPWIGESRQPTRRKPETQRPRKPEPSTADRRQVLAAFMKTQPIQGRHNYLEGERCISRTTLSDPRFKDMVRVDGRGNAIFPHYDRDGISGYEVKNHNFTGFAKNGEKRLWHSVGAGEASRIVLVESAIDAMSHAQLTLDKEAGYISIGGQPNDEQRQLLKGMLSNAEKKGVTVILATDADEVGRQLADLAISLAPSGLKIERQEPAKGKDWNEALVEQQNQESRESRGMER